MPPSDISFSWRGTAAASGPDIRAEPRDDNEDVSLPSAIPMAGSQRADKRVSDVTAAAEEARASNDHGGDSVELEEVAEERRARIGAAGEDYSANAGTQARDDIGRDQHAVERDAHAHRRFRLAAEACAISQPALSMQIKELEAELGNDLFERSARDVKLTAFGETFAHRARDILRAVDELGELARAARNPFLARLRIGIIPTVAPYLLPAIINDLTGTFDGTTARMSLDIIPGSGTDGLDGITGHAEHASTHADYPHFPLLLTYEVSEVG